MQSWNSLLVEYHQCRDPLSLPPPRSFSQTFARFSAIELMKFEIVPAHDLPFEAQARIFNRAFASYLVAFKEMDASGLAQFVCAQGVDLCYSRFGRVNGDLAVFGYVNCTGNISRLAAMGVVPDARRSGAANFLLSHLIDEAKARADQAMVLECFEQNGAALALYRKNKFREVTQLFGWRRSPGPLNILAGCDTEEISLIEASHISCRIDFPDLPWQVSRHAVAKIPEGRAYRIKNICRD
jgi:ribosomal protein S18 acetylase RimI-like enzyme